MTLHEDSSGTPSTTSLGTLATTTTTLPSTFGLLQYNASGNGISLDANKTYWVLIDVAGATGNHTQTQTTTSGDEDSGGATGWSIASDHLGRGSTATDWSASATVSGVIHIRINGSAKGPPEPQSIQNVQGTQKREVEIAFDKNLDASSTPHHGNFQARFPFFGGTTYTSSGVKITGDKVNLIFPVTIGTGIPEWVKYTKPSSGNKLKGTNGVEVASFTFPEQAQTTPPPRTPSSGFTPPPSRDDGGRVAPGPWISPRPHRVDLSGTDVIVSMDKAVVLDTANYTTAQLAAKFTVWVNGDRRAVEGASVSGYQVTLDLGSSYSAPAGARVAVNYARGPAAGTPPPPRNRWSGASAIARGRGTRPGRTVWTPRRRVWSSAWTSPCNWTPATRRPSWRRRSPSRVNGTAHKPTGATVSGRDIHLDIGHPVAGRRQGGCGLHEGSAAGQHRHAGLGFQLRGSRRVTAGMTRGSHPHPNPPPSRGRNSLVGVTGFGRRY